MLLKILISIKLFILLTKATSINEDLNSVFVEISEHNRTVVLKGTQNYTWTGESYYAFRGIPYAKPPIAALRFKAPEPLDLRELIDATADGHDCPSIYATNPAEDCLILNVYSKNLSANAALPVIVFIHPGGLYLGSSLSSFIGPDYLLAQPIVLVTLNYRLGTLGFLSLGTRDIPGNAGFKDQVLALRWIQKYIKYFGGNAADVTLMGYSAGALSVSLHLVSPMSAGHFHKAIIMSGALPPQTLLPRGAQPQLALRQAKVLNCAEAEDVTLDSAMFATVLLDCFNRYNGTAIAATLRRMFDFGKDNPIYLWLPVLERDFGQERFLDADFYDSLRRGTFHKVPLLIGYTDGEFCTSAADILRDEQLTRRFNDEFVKLAPKLFMYEEAADARRLSAAIKSHYLGESALDRSDFEQLCNLFSDAIIRIGAQRLARLAARHVDVFSYKFAFRGEYSNLQFGTSDQRAEHMDDLMYIFKMAPHHFKPTDRDAFMVQLYTNFIVDFAKNGKISANVTSHFPHSYALVATQLAHKSGTNFEAAEFWEQLLFA